MVLKSFVSTAWNVKFYTPADFIEWSGIFKADILFFSINILIWLSTTWKICLPYRQQKTKLSIKLKAYAFTVFL